MHNYETKFIARSGIVSLQVSESYFSDFAAIRAARRLCGKGDNTLEVWRGDVCVYSEHPRPIRLVWPVCSKGAPG